jgi:membrane peptidoglycan carboxypeptidase
MGTQRVARGGVGEAVESSEGFSPHAPMPSPARPGLGRGLFRTSRLLISLVVVSAVFGVIACGFVLPVVASTSQALSLGSAVFDVLPSSLPSTPVPQTSVILASNGTPIAYLYDENRTAVPLAQMSPLIQKAIVAVEDSRFYEHGAIDPKGVIRALISNSAGGSTEGASTLTQQYVKNLLLESATATGDKAAAQAAVARTTARKLREAKIAMTAEQQLTKDQILEGYLNLVYFGDHSYGVQAAAMRYFGVSAASLTLPQAALLAGLVQDPSKYDPVAHPHAALVRRNVVLADMHNQGLITTAQYTAAHAAKVVVRGSVPSNGCIASGVAGYFCEYVVQSLILDNAYSALGATPAERANALQTGGLVIRTGLDLHAQEAALKAVDDAIPPGDSSGLGTAAVTVQPGTGLVTAMTQNRTYAITSGTGKTSVNYSVDSNLGGARGFQTGSSFKPFTLATWLQSGRTVDDTVDATKRAFPFSDFTSCGRPLQGSQPYNPGNSEGTETGSMSVLQATTNSVNVAYVDMESQLDLCDIVSTAQKLGVHLAAPERECSTTAPLSTDLPNCLPSLTLGVKDIAPLTMAAAYAGFASGGTFCAPLPVTSITQRTSAGGTTPVATFGPQCHQALTPDVASQVNSTLTHVLTEGTAAAVGPLDGHPSAGKTGTTDGPYDTWFVGYTAQRSTAVWVGDPGRTVNGTFVRRQLTDIEVGGHFFGTVFGASIAAPIWKVAMTAAMQGLPEQPLP